ncbi:MAG: formate dehydrogenase subunit delta [Defluviimonas sp.]|uniref:formate dehydrogenase subunit delta n=1 Tax=Albidovulum sp. TaxID=1872424 RepID=UPI001D6899E1|nr:formate dehydrogenase subunit delta [Paracoccaceae bacterium]MCC0062874.1 formate dehydrogenase subunit delta [Defluviimonas sp.]
MSPEKLLYMAKQIATFFASQPGADQADCVAQHIRDFWEPRMREQFLALAADPKQEMPELVRSAAAKLAA